MLIGSPLQAAVTDAASAGARDFRQYIGGEWVEAGGEAFAVVNPTTMRWLCSVTAARRRVPMPGAAVAAAADAAPSWRDMPFDDRAAILLKPPICSPDRGATG